MALKRIAIFIRLFSNRFVHQIGLLLFLALPFSLIGFQRAWSLGSQKNYLALGYWHVFLESIIVRVIPAFLGGFLLVAPVYLVLRRMLRRSGDLAAPLIFLLTFIAWWNVALFVIGRAIPLDLGLAIPAVRSLLTYNAIIFVPMLLYSEPATRLGLLLVFLTIYLLVNGIGILLGLLVVRLSRSIISPLYGRLRINGQRLARLGRHLAGFGWLAAIFFVLLIYFPLPDGVKSQGPNLILISIDTLRADHLGCYGYPRPVSPTLDALAEEGIVFTDVFADAPWTLPSHATMLSGCDSLTHGAVLHDRGMAKRLLLLPEILHEAGYETKALVSSIFLSPHYGFAAGFEEFHFWIDDRRSDALVDRAIRLIDEHRRPFFLFLHLFDPHWPYDPPPETMREGKEAYIGVRRPAQFTEFMAWVLQAGPVMQEKTRHLYDEEIYFTDAQLARLFAHLREAGLWNQTVVAVTSDHGEELFDHGLWGHGHALYQEQLHVPLLIHLPPLQSPGPRRIDTPVGLVDLAPSLLEILGLDPPATMEGRSFAELMTHDDAAPRSEDYLAYLRLRRPASEQIALRHGRFKYFSPAEDVPFGKFIISHPERLFDLTNDPGEQTDLLGERPEQVRLLKDTLNEILSRKIGDLGPKTPLSPDMHQRLRSLGYLQ